MQNLTSPLPISSLLISMTLLTIVVYLSSGIEVYKTAQVATGIALALVPLQVPNSMAQNRRTLSAMSAQFINPNGFT